MNNNSNPVAYLLHGTDSDDNLIDAERYQGFRTTPRATPLYSIPEGYSLVPDSTTSAQKFRVNGEFSMDRHVDCHDCDPEDVDPECEECNGEGSYYHKQVIPWTTCKDIYYAMIKAAKEGE